MAMSVVAIVKGQEPIEITVKALEMVGAEQACSTEKQILVKPNYINADHPSTGVTTDGRVIEGVVRFFREHGFRNVIIGEGAGFADTFHAFRVAGVDKVAERWGVSMVDLNKDEFVTVKPSNPYALQTVRVAKTVLESCIVSVPKLKLHKLAGVTLSLKNMMGAVTPKGSIHGPLSEKIVDLASIITPSVAVIDGIIGGEGSETAGEPVEMNLVIAGRDPVAVDAVGAAVMGVDPRSVKHLVLAEEKGLGVCDLGRIKVLGEPIEKVRRNFKGSFFSKVLHTTSLGNLI